MLLNAEDKGPTAADCITSEAHLRGKQDRVSPSCCLLQETRDPMLQWIALALETNSKERSKMKMNHALAAPHGLFINLDSVLLKMCEPFLEPASGKAWPKIDAR